MFVVMNKSPSINSSKTLSPEHTSRILKNVPYMQYHRSRLCSIAEKQVPEKDKASIGMQSYDERQKWHQQALLVALENTTGILQARSLQKLYDYNRHGKKRNGKQSISHKMRA